MARGPTPSRPAAPHDPHPARRHGHRRLRLDAPDRLPGAARLSGRRERLDAPAHGAPGRPAADDLRRARGRAAGGRRLGAAGARAASTTGSGAAPASSTACTSAAAPVPTGRAARWLLDENAARRRPRLPRPRRLPGQPGRPAAGLLGRPRRQRGLHAAGARPRHRRGPARRARSAPTTAWPGRPTATASSTRPLDEAYRPDQVHRHVLGTTQHGDEPSSGTSLDRRFELEIEATRSGDFVVLVAFSRDTSEIRLVPTAEPTPRPRRRTAARARAANTTSTTSAGPDGGRLLLVVDDAGARVPARRAAGRARRRQRPAGALARDPAAPAPTCGSSTSPPSPTTSSSPSARRPAPAARARRERAGRCGWCARTRPARTSRLGRNEEYDVAAVRLVREGWVRPPSRRRPLARRRPRVGRTHATGVAAASTTTTARSSRWSRRRDGVARCPPLRRWCAGVGCAGTGRDRACSTATAPTRSCLDPEFWYQMRPLLDRGFVVRGRAHPRRRRARPLRGGCRAGC